MSHLSKELLLEESVAKLTAISERRDVLLREMHQMIRRRHDLGPIFGVDDQDEEDLQAFLLRFHITTDNPDAGSIINLTESEILPLHFKDDDNSTRSISSKGNPTSKRSMRSRQKLDIAEFPRQESSRILSPRPSVSSTAEPTSGSLIQELEDDDELDLLKASPLSHAQSIYFKEHTIVDNTPESPERSVEGSLRHGRLGRFEAGVLGGETKVNVNNPQETTNPLDLKSSEQMDIDVDVSRSNPQEVKTQRSAGTLEDIAVSTVSLHHIFSDAIHTAAAKPPVIVRSTLPSGSPEPAYVFNEVLQPQISFPTPVAPLERVHQFKPEFTLPSLKLINPEHIRKAKSARRKREGISKKENNDWTPLGLNKWAATINANPVWKKVARSNKCLSTREWATAMSELRFIRAIERIESLKREGRWSFRQPKKQRAIGGVPKTHWDHVMDEMKWMRVDFREERKWKLALAYNLSTAVLDWWTAGTMEVRVVRGICVRWKRPLSEHQGQDVVMEDSVDFNPGAHRPEIEVTDSEGAHPQQSTSLLGVDYGSEEEEEDDDEEDEDEDEDKDKISQDVIDPLAPSTLLQEALDDSAAYNDHPTNTHDSQDIQPKTEEVEDMLALTHHEPSTEADGGGKLDPALALKASSNDPILASQSTPSGPGLSLTTATKSTKTNIYAPFRELIAYSENDKLFLDLQTFDMSKIDAPGATSSDDAALPTPDLAAIFPDLPILTLFDPTPVIQAPAIPSADGKKRSEKRSDRDDPTKRPDDILYTKLYPTGEFMMSKPTLIGPLRPSKNWKNGQWLPLDETPVAPEETLPKISDDNSDIFETRFTNSPSHMIALSMQTAYLKNKEHRKRLVEHLWSNADDLLLKTLIDRYPHNWPLIAECFNGSRLTISTDKRTFHDCYERWRDTWAPELRRLTENSSAVDTTPTQMTTRGVKRLASTSVSSVTPVGMATGSEPRKRRRHLLVQETIRKAGKKRAEALQKIQNTQRKQPTIHETHAQYAKLPKRTPAELSRAKAEKEARELAEIQQARKRQEELHRQNMSRVGPNGTLPPPNMTQPVQPQPQQPQQAQVAGVMQRPVGTAIPGSSQVPQIRSQVNISQQQRTNTPSMQARAQHMLQAQARAAQQQAQVHAQALAQAQNVVQSTAVAVNSPHLSPPYANRDITSSPAHVSPPLGSAVPSTANSPRPPSAQAHPLLQAAQVPGNAGTRGGYYLPNVPLTTEQIHTALRLQQQQQQQQQGFPVNPS